MKQAMAPLQRNSLALFLGLGFFGLLSANQGARRDQILTKEQVEILSHLSLVHLDDGQGGTNKTVRMEGVNFQIVNGLGATNGAPGNILAPGMTNGVGNLIVGYNELGKIRGDDRTGSHSIVVGAFNDYSSFGGLVAGFGNSVSGRFSSVTGGWSNTAAGSSSSVSGGRSNLAGGPYSSVGGGERNSARSHSSSVSGGTENEASGYFSSVQGGLQNTASGMFSSVGGGSNDEARGWASSVSGGLFRTALGMDDWVAGTLLEDK